MPRKLISRGASGLFSVTRPDKDRQIDKNRTLPCTISSVRVLGASNTRPTFLKRILEPILSANQDRPYTLSEAIRETQFAVDKLHRLGVFALDRFAQRLLMGQISFTNLYP